MVEITDDLRMRILVIQYAGDYLTAYERLKESGAETYYGHKYVLEQLARIQNELGEVAIVCCASGREYSRRIESGVTVIGANANSEKEFAKLRGLMCDFNPTHLVVLGPLPKVLAWGIKNDLKILCLCADSFEINRFRRIWRYGLLRKQLNNKAVEWVANHGKNACVSLCNIGVNHEKVISWDWPHGRKPSLFLPKKLTNKNIRLLYAGALSESKGVGDLIRAVAILEKQGVEVDLNIAGGGEFDQFKKLAFKLGVDRKVNFLGMVSNDFVFAEMREATLVVVPSRHNYPEGLPLTIYESLCARTPIIASDHPMFKNHLIHRETAMIFKEKRPHLMANCIDEIISNPALYEKLSTQSESAWKKLQNPVKWGDLIFRWLRNKDMDKQWLKESSMKLPE